MGELGELSPEFADSLVNADRAAELSGFVTALHWAIPALWLLALMLLWRVSVESCVQKVTRRYQVFVLGVVAVSGAGFGLSFAVAGVVSSLGLLICAWAAVTWITYVLLRRYKEEYL